MTLKPIKSTNIHSIGYDPVTSELKIKFHTGKTYTYRDVPPDIYQNLVSADSAGQFFHTNIRNSFKFNRGG